VPNVRPTLPCGRDGYLRVFYYEIGVKFETYNHWVASGEMRFEVRAISSERLAWFRDDFFRPDLVRSALIPIATSSVAGTVAIGIDRPGYHPRPDIFSGKK
jgi:hypothetical protein